MISIKEAEPILNIKERRIRVLCDQGRIHGAKKIGSVWVLPDNPTITPAGRVRPSKYPKADNE